MFFIPVGEEQNVTWSSCEDGHREHAQFSLLAFQHAERALISLPDESVNRCLPVSMTVKASYQHQGGRLRSSRERSTEDKKNPLKLLKRFGEAVALTRWEPRGELGIAW